MSVKKFMLSMAAFVAVMGLAANSAFASTSHNVRHQTGGWTVLGGDPLVPGGVWSARAFQHLMTSTKGQTAMRYDSLNEAERRAITQQVRMGNFHACTMNYGELFWRMSYGIHGTAVDKNVRFADPRYRGGAPAWCVTAHVGGKGGYTVRLKVPKKCANVAVPKKPHRSHKHPKKRKQRQPTPTPSGSCNVTINGTVTGNVIVCSTYTITVICGNLSQTFTGSDKNTVVNQASSWQQANCSSSPPPPATCTDTSASNYGGPLPCVYPPPVTLTLSGMTSPQNAAGGIAPDGETVTVCVKVTDTKPGDYVKLEFEATLGWFENNGIVSFTSTGADQECDIYHAPNDSNDVGQTETWSVSGVDTTASVLGNPNPLSTSFVLQQPASGR